MTKPKMFLIILITFCLFLGNNLCLGKTLTTFPGLGNPMDLKIIGDKIFISDNCTIFCYSLSDHQLIKKFGRQGEGPGEFMTYATLGLSHN